MNKTMSRIFALLLALVMCIAVSATAFAEEEFEMPVAPNASGSITVKDTMTLDEGASVPNKDFTFTLAAATPSEGKTFIAPDYAGIMEGVGSSYTASFASVTASDGKAIATFTIDFTGVKFENPGVYHYTLTGPTLSSPFSLPENATNTRSIDVYVGYYVPEEEEAEPDAEEDGEVDADFDTETLCILSVVMYTGDKPTDQTKSEGFEVEYTTYDLTLEKTVTGNQGNRNEYFEFEITIDSCTVDGSYTVNTENGNSYTTTANPTSITVTNGTGNATFHLKSGESVTVKELPAGTKYTITEKSTGYKVSYVINENGDPEEITGSNDSYEYKDTTGLTGDTNVEFINNKTGTIPTGILLTIAPFAALMVIGIAGVIFIVLKKRGEEK